MSKAGEAERYETRRRTIEELDMSTIQEQSGAASRHPHAKKVNFKLEAVVIPVSDVDRSKSFYGSLGWRLDADFAVGDAFRVVQFTPPGSPASVHFGKGLTSATPGAAQNIYLIVSDIEAAHAELIARGAKVSDVFHRAGPGQPPLSGRDRRGAVMSRSPL
jgi:catechol 2,3-dioxygenase-like lactoylglutathione lyase family enzyme